jgi:hypothetical protein
MSRRPSEKKIIEALQGTMGKVYLAAEKLGCTPEAIYACARRSPRVRGTIRHFRGKLLDAAEATLWRKVLEGEPWAVKLALTEWGRSRGFSDGAEAWHAPSPADDDIPCTLVRQMVLEVLHVHVYVEDCRSRQLDADSRAVRGEGEPRKMEVDAAPGGDRPGDRGDDSGEVGPDPGD